MFLMKTRRLRFSPKARTEWRIEAPGCVVYLHNDVNGDLVCTVDADGDRYADQGVKLATVQGYWVGESALGRPLASGAKTVRVQVGTGARR